ncbi:MULTISPECIES: ABC transporter ATP-binding protein [unclassified Halomonas]|uniref:ABC transporter ATP-binding protein n=1 Tax=unclassified Halomonas TaxID=2609666 RepID=UPI002885FBE3|nr:MULTISPECIES: ABC transporter ATP-binding protein [unclassified Halomonas]MDT0501114.1 ABC transporter ATP-binding protein [Halomonas sp. PAR7]MDT0513305.1 ABC transporter ATP-binding protein [Halomonas sp. LES1]MDT0592182.1 ABC transporter ATP-binding protein [Halomonas sp. PAR8]
MHDDDLLVHSVGLDGRLAVEGPLAAPAGAVTVLLGPNGAGKSTLLRALAGIEPARLAASLGGRELATLSSAERREAFYYLPQLGGSQAALSVHEAVLLSYKTLHPGRVRRQDLAHVEAALDSMGLMALAGRRLASLSGGQYQRVAIAQAVVRRPRVLMLDEPTSALDLHQQLRVLEWVRAEADRGRSVLLALHDLNLAARFADHCWLLKEGRCQAAGPATACLTADHLEPLFKVRLSVDTGPDASLRIQALGL